MYNHYQKYTLLITFTYSRTRIIFGYRICSFTLINILKTKISSNYIQKFSTYRAVNTLHLSYTNQ